MEFAAVSSVDATTLRWLRRGDRPLAFDLSSAERPLASLDWNADLGTLATARSKAGTWTLKRIGFLNPRVTVRAEGSDENLAQLTVHLNYHRIDVTGGGTFRFHRAGVLVPAWKVYRETGEEVLHVEPVREGRKLAAGAAIAPPAATSLPEFAVLVVLSWYFVSLAWFEDEALTPLEAPTFTPVSPG
jgi:hypothetical protein